MKGKIKIVIKYLLTIAILLFICANHNCYAILQQTETTDGGGRSDTGTKETILHTDQYKPKTLTDDETATEAINTIIGIIKTVGTIISVGALMLIGIGYMTGSAEGKADYKKTMLPYFIGCILLFAGSQFVQIIYDIAKSM